MKSTWFAVRVEIVHHHDENLWPYPGRLLLVRDTHTFAQLAEAVDTGFARWDRSARSEFTLPDGTTLDGGSERPIGDLIRPRDVFRYVFDPEAWWVHRCEVAPFAVDPTAAHRELPDRPEVIDGWGQLPDPFLRRWEEDDGASHLPARPDRPEPMIERDWPVAGPREQPVDLAQLRQAVAHRDAAAIVAALAGRGLCPALQEAGGALLAAMENGSTDAREVSVTVVAALRDRAWDGDVELADELDAALRSEARTGQLLPVDLDEVADLLEGDPAMNEGGYLDLDTGETWHGSAMDPHLLEEMGIDLEEEPDRWLHLPCSGSHDGWEDMAVFSAGQADRRLRDRLEDAIEGRGAFRRFKDVVHDEGIAEQWYAFSAERRTGRARSWLAAAGIRARARRWPSGDADAST